MNQLSNTSPMSISNIESYLLSIYGLLSIICFLLYNSYINNKNKNKKYVPDKRWYCGSIGIIPAHPHLEASLNALVMAPKFIKWLQRMNPDQVKINSITITDINWFSAVPTPSKLGFVKCSLDAIDKTTGKKIASNIAFVRGDSVAILIIVKIANGSKDVTKDVTKDVSKDMTKDMTKEYVLLCEQMRLPAGERKKEICAGMVDAEGNLASVSLKEVKEETGFVINNISELTSLGSVFTSPGGLDEEVHLYSWTTTISQKEFKEKQSKLYGNQEEQEEIKLSFVEINRMLESTLREIGDVKAECALFRHILSTRNI